MCLRLKKSIISQGLDRWSEVHHYLSTVDLFWAGATLIYKIVGWSASICWPPPAVSEQQESSVVVDVDPVKTNLTWGSAAWAHCCCTCSESLLGSTTKDSGSEMRTQMMYCPDSGLLWDGKKDQKHQIDKEWVQSFNLCFAGCKFCQND